MPTINEELKVAKAQYQFQYMPLNGRLSGMSFEQQTEDAINDIGNVSYLASENANLALNTANEANKKSQEALEIANRAESIANNANTTANEAMRIANNANVNSGGATNIANEAMEKATQALSEAGIAKETAMNASEQANTAQQLAQEAGEEAKSANILAQNLQRDIEAHQREIDGIQEYELVAEALDLNSLYSFNRKKITNLDSLNLPVRKAGLLDVDFDDDETVSRQIYTTIETANVYIRYATLSVNEETQVTTPTWGFWRKNSTEEEVKKVKTELENKINAGGTALDAHKQDYNNPHKVTAAQLGLASAYVYKGSVENYAALPIENIGEGWVYNVQTADKAHNIKAGDNVAWTGTAWDVLSGIFDTSDIDEKISGLENKTSGITVEDGKTVIDGIKVEDLNDSTSTNLQALTDKVNKNTNDIANKANKADVYTKAETDTFLNSKAPLASPAFTGTPTAPTPDRTANNTQIATTAFVKELIAESGEIDLSEYAKKTEVDAVVNPVSDKLNKHEANKANPHNVTAQQVGITFSTTDLTAGTSALATGKIYIVYE